MNDTKKINRPILAVCLAVLLVLLLVFIVFLSRKSDADRVEITLPDSSADAPSTEQDSELRKKTFLQINEDNAVEALTALSRPDHYHQQYVIEMEKGIDAEGITVDLWVKDVYRRAQIASAGSVKHMVSDGSRIWMWYDNDTRAVSFDMTPDATFEDLLGLPAFDYLQTLKQAKITEAEYLVLEADQGERLCIFISALDDRENPVRYWINLETALLYVADCVENNTQIYRVEEISFDKLAPEDEVFTDKFLLPDGTSVISAETQTP